MIGPRSGLGAMMPIVPMGSGAGLSYYANGGVGAIDWGNLFGQWSTAGIDIVKNVTDPRYNAGTYSRTDASGNTIVYAQPAGSNVPIFTSSDVSSSIGANARLGAQTSGGFDPTMLLLLGVGLFLVVTLSRR